MCTDQQLHTYKAWIRNVDNRITEEFKDDAFRDACEHGHLEIAKYIYSLGGVIIMQTEIGYFVGLVKMDTWGLSCISTL